MTRWYAWLPSPAGLILLFAIAGVVVFDPLGLFHPGAFAQETAPGAPAGNTSLGAYDKIGNALVMVFVLAVLIEVGLDVIFRWRIFLRYFEGKGVKIPIALVVSFIIVKLHDIDLPSAVVSAFQASTEAVPAPGTLIGYFISALIIAGGSASVNTVFQKIGLRSPDDRREKAEVERQNNPPPAATGGSS